EDVGPAGGEILQIGDRGLPLCTGERRLNGGDVVEMQDRDQMVAGGAARGPDRSAADLVLAQAGNPLGDRDVLLEIVRVERARVARLLVHDQESRHPRAPHRYQVEYDDPNGERQVFWRSRCGA